jgi:hypothetical protein
LTNVDSRMVCQRYEGDEGECIRAQREGKGQTGFNRISDHASASSESLAKRHIRALPAFEPKADRCCREVVGSQFVTTLNSELGTRSILAFISLLSPLIAPIQPCLQEPATSGSTSLQSSPTTSSFSPPYLLSSVSPFPPPAPSLPHVFFALTLSPFIKNLACVVRRFHLADRRHGKL